MRCTVSVGWLPVCAMVQLDLKGGPAGWLDLLYIPCPRPRLQPNYCSFCCHYCCFCCHYRSCCRPLAAAADTRLMLQTQRTAAAATAIDAGPCVVLLGIRTPPLLGRLLLVCLWLCLCKQRAGKRANCQSHPHEPLQTGVDGGSRDGKTIWICLSPLTVAAA
jgi:hypothetical protein